MGVYYDDKGNITTAVPNYSVTIDKQIFPLKLYFVAFSIHQGKEWTAFAGYIFASGKDRIAELIKKAYGETYIRTVEEVPVEEGTILYGKQWRTLQ